MFSHKKRLTGSGSVGQRVVNTTSGSKEQEALITTSGPSVPSRHPDNNMVDLCSPTQSSHGGS